MVNLFLVPSTLPSRRPGKLWIQSVALLLRLNLSHRPYWNIDLSANVYVTARADQLEEIDGDVPATVRRWSANFALVNGIL